MNIPKYFMDFISIKSTFRENCPNHVIYYMFYITRYWSSKTWYWWMRSVQYLTSFWIHSSSNIYYLFRNGPHPRTWELSPLQGQEGQNNKQWHQWCLQYFLPCATISPQWEMNMVLTHRNLYIFNCSAVKCRHDIYDWI